MLWVAELDVSMAGTGTPATLPIGSVQNMTTGLEKSVEWLYLTLNTQHTNAGVGLAYNRSMGPLTNVIVTNMCALFASTIQPSDAGTEAWFMLGLEFISPSGVYLNVAVPVQTTFTVEFTNGQPMIPWSTLIRWPYFNWIPIPQAMERVTGVEYVLWVREEGYETYREFTRNGMPTNAWCSELVYGDGVMYLDAQIVSSNILEASWGLTGEVIIHYQGGGYDAFTTDDGAKVRSTAFWLTMSQSNNAPCVSISGWPGLRVAVETSTNASWTQCGLVILDPQGKAYLPLTASPQPLFVRGRLVTP